DPARSRSGHADYEDDPRVVAAGIHGGRRAGSGALGLRAGWIGSKSQGKHAGRADSFGKKACRARRPAGPIKSWTLDDPQTQRGWTAPSPPTLSVHRVLSALQSSSRTT